MSVATGALVVGILALLACLCRMRKRSAGGAFRAENGRAAGSVGGPCPGGTVCAGGVCVPCDPAHPCPAGLVCAKGACALCGPGAPCPAGLVCAGGLCAPCDDAHPCPGGQVCAAGACVPCDPAHPCPGGRVCVAGACTPCSSAVPCPGGQVCAGGACVPCDPTHPCPPGQVCSGGACGPCDATHPCPDGWVCVGGACIPACTPCDDDTRACPAGQVCVLGTCVAAPACGPGAPCPGGLTCGTDGRCAACYVWRTWSIGEQPARPPDLYGYGGGSAPAGADPLGDGSYYVGFVDSAGRFTGATPGGDTPAVATPQVNYLSAPKNCPAPAVSDPAHAVSYHGMGACLDLSQGGVFTQYHNQKCTPRSGYSLQLFAPPAGP